MTARSAIAAPGYSAGERMRRLLCEEMWNIGIIDQPIQDIARRGIVTAPRWLPPPTAGTMLADPACRMHPDGGCTLYAEHLDYRGRGIGEIWYAEIAPGADLATAHFRPLLRPPYHMSYPFPLQDAASNRALLTAESWNAGGALLWQEDDGARQVGAIMDDRQVVDPTLWHDGKGWWLFCTFQDVDPNGALFLYHAPTLSGPWTTHPGNPVQSGRGRSRPAGPLFYMDGVLVRPAQDCSATYGGAVVLQAVTRLDGDHYEETQLRRLAPQPGRYCAGLHTICAAGNRTLIDGKSWHRNLGGLPAKILRRTRKFLDAQGKSSAAS